MGDPVSVAATFRLTGTFVWPSCVVLRRDDGQVVNPAAVRTAQGKNASEAFDAGLERAPLAAGSEQSMVTYLTWCTASSFCS